MNGRLSLNVLHVCVALLLGVLLSLTMGIGFVGAAHAGSGLDFPDPFIDPGPDEYDFAPDYWPDPEDDLPLPESPLPLPDDPWDDPFDDFPAPPP
jgi:hypothetical protein